MGNVVGNEPPGRARILVDATGANCEFGANAAWQIVVMRMPNADPEKSWEVIRATLEAGNGEGLAMAIQEFDNMRDDGRVAFAVFSALGLHAELLLGRIQKCVTENLDEDEAEELLSLVGMDDYDEDEEDDE